MGFAIELDGASHEVEILALRPRLTLRIDGRVCAVATPDDGGDGESRIEIDGETIAFTRVRAGGRQILRLAGRTMEAALLDPRERVEAAGASQDQLRAPMPGTVVEVHKRPGEAVARGETLVTIESMKLQMTLVAPRDGVVAEIARAAGETFDKDDIVARLAPLERS